VVFWIEVPEDQVRLPLADLIDTVRSHVPQVVRGYVTIKAETLAELDRLYEEGADDRPDLRDGGD
jgi:hypothetical protein